MQLYSLLPPRTTHDFVLPKFSWEAALHYGLLSSHLYARLELCFYLRGQLTEWTSNFSLGPDSFQWIWLYLPYSPNQYISMPQPQLVGPELSTFGENRQTCRPKLPQPQPHVLVFYSTILKSWLRPCFYGIQFSHTRLFWDVCHYPYPLNARCHTAQFLPLASNVG